MEQQKTYTVTVYRRFYKKTYKNVIGDGLLPAGPGRYLLLSTGEMIELQHYSAIKFAPERKEFLKNENILEKGEK